MPGLSNDFGLFAKILRVALTNSFYKENMLSFSRAKPVEYSST